MLKENKIISNELYSEIKFVIEDIYYVQFRVLIINESLYSKSLVSNFINKPDSNLRF